MVPIRLSEREAAAIAEVAKAMGVEYSVDALRALPRIYDERMRLVRAALEPLRGRLTVDDVIMVIQVANGIHDLREHAGVPAGLDLLASISDATNTDGADRKRILREVRKAGPAVGPALAYWAEMLWRRSEDDRMWKRERKWLATRDE